MSDLIALEQLNPLSVFVNNGLDEIIDKIEADVKSIATDATTKKGRDEIASLAYKVARSKTTLDEMGKSLTEDWKKKSAAVDAERKRMRERMDKIKDEVRKPLTDFENAEKERVSDLETRLSEIKVLSTLSGDENQDDIRALLERAEGIDLTNWQEFTDAATQAKQYVVSSLTSALEKRTQYDKDQAELARLREEAIKREREEREASIAAEAAEKARKVAEQKADEERQRILKEKQEAERAAADAVEQARLAEQRASEAAQRERDRIASEKKREDEEATRREADKAHKAKIHNDILKGMSVAGRIDGSNDEEYKNIIKAIAKGEIPNLKIIY